MAIAPVVRANHVFAHQDGVNSEPPTNSPIEQARAQTWFYAGCAIEGALALAAILIARLSNHPLESSFPGNTRDVAWGVAATVPMLALLAWMANSCTRAVRDILNFLATIRPIFRQWSVFQLAIISGLAGAGEELLFRGVIQAQIGRWIGDVPGLIIASALFGGFHFVNRAYALFAALIGGYLGVIWLWTDSLLVPIIAHAAYDFIALVYFFRIRQVARE